MLIQAEKKHLTGVLYLYHLSVRDMNARGLFNWNTHYPSSRLVSDIEKGNLYIWIEEEMIMAAACMDNEMPDGYEDKNWSKRGESYLVVHRLAVIPGFHNRGIGEKVMNALKELAVQRGCTTIRLDVFTGNPGAVQLYKKLGYSEVGEVHFEYQKVPFMCLEKILGE
ncbi:MAG: GNAT family N-acetyltransferase [Bacteroidales bacterium]|nr:GNAT family N-acetyltransferase [Bacteroidales bacterium]MCB9000155.1 GNAT family N-acetyltransferase [Bacteroidales bacterium]MCB9013512.1 GNAT family N-acetyltransferase [Bacteroidales bacterium]